ncbi:MAG: Lrp/AsnC ligand binding domain-containing protein [Candidatus Methanomethylicia archaeon]|jgi:DNA-binding Lrp family transcriptional regulator|uniref:Lrp/AsnC family transcriptional regulator n=1 Tax=Thermoproteota archaeon TaxID=2056631 RepID=A0A523BDV4_9CREN|nr:Lrp/AsnC ligand binding domain-containing protein [Candidatus Methanomethylicia archaeon]MCQ5373736.1 Lrp/AsnC ligand binding domain-containing protein [Candidatus Methanomethylicia archaeon]NHV60279.1 Lrp/AsnC family transcriptional regulator [Candidatus Verstraetearchaeota archaeon]TDA39126.1 MAG: Lrp/AsnC family transcriptional regulator [Candidatus Verstraetearchaeota archaeon]
MNGVVAYMLLVTDTGKEYDVINEVKKISGITECRAVYGEFDVFIRIEVADFVSLDEIVTQIRRVPGVLQTTTLVSSP